MSLRRSAVGYMLLLSLGAAAWPYSTYKSVDFQPPKLKVNRTGPIDSDFIFISPRGRVQPAGQAPLIYDLDGNLVYEGPKGPSANFKVQQLNGVDVVTFWAGDISDMGFGFGSIHILDNTYTEIHTVTLTDAFVTPDNSIKDSYIDMHESQITPKNTLLVTAYNLTLQNLTSIGGNFSAWVVDSLFYEINIATNQILTSWSALDHEAEIPLSTSRQKLGPRAGTQKNPYDAYHINSIETTNHGFFLSLRHTWSGYYLNHNGTVMWRVSGKDGGDFTQIGNANFSWQHDMRLYNETDDSLAISLLNNANTPTDHETATAGLQLTIDLINKTVTGVRSLTDPNDTIYSVSQGSYQILSETDNRVFIGYGSIAKVKEFDGNGRVIYSAQFGEDNAISSYRGYRYQWHATPFWKPSVKVIRSGNAVTVYMSWNGATEYDNWVVYSATSQTSVHNQEVSTAKRTGFETAVTLRNLPTRYIQVVARQGDRTLSTSETVTF